jgi:hypothetical protein
MGSTLEALPCLLPVRSDGTNGSAPTDLNKKIWERLGDCPNPTVHRFTGEPSPCGRSACDRCLIKIVRDAAVVMRASGCTHAIGLSFPGIYDFDIVKSLLRKILRELRRICPGLAWAGGLEFYPGGTGIHAHLYGHGGTGEMTITKAQLEAAARKVGAGPLVFLKKIRLNSTKTYFSYPFKNVVNPDPAERQAWIDANTTGRGLEFVFSSPGFWRDGADGPQMTKAELLRATKPWNRANPQYHEQQTLKKKIRAYEPVTMVLAGIGTVDEVELDPGAIEEVIAEAEDIVRSAPPPEAIQTTPESILSPSTPLGGESDLIESPECHSPPGFAYRWRHRHQLGDQRRSWSHRLSRSIRSWFHRIDPHEP